MKFVLMLVSFAAHANSGSSNEELDFNEQPTEHILVSNSAKRKRHTRIISSEDEGEGSETTGCERMMGSGNHQDTVSVSLESPSSVSTTRSENDTRSYESRTPSEASEDEDFSDGDDEPHDVKSGIRKLINVVPDRDM